MPIGSVIVSIVIPHVAGQENLDRVLHSVPKAFPKSNVEIIVVMNGANSILPSFGTFQDSVACLKEIRLDNNCGFATGCNEGAAIAHGEFLLFLNDDVEMTPNSGDILLRAALRDTDGAAWQPLVFDANSKELDAGGSYFGPFGFLVHNFDRQDQSCSLQSVKRVFAAKGACLLVRRHVFESEHGFDGRFFAYWEETDLQWRMQLSGWKVGVVAASKVLHIGGATSRKIFSDGEINFLSFRNRMWSIARNVDRRNLVIILPMHFLIVCVVGLVSTITGRRETARGIFGALKWVLLNYKMISADRKEIQSERLESDKIVLRHRVRFVALPTQLRILGQYLRSYRD